MVHRNRDPVYTLSRDHLARRLHAWGEPEYRVTQLWHALYQEMVPSFQAITVWPKALRARMEEELLISSLSVVDTLASRDGNTRKHLFDLPQGGRVEAVCMRYRQRITACISSQAGCGMGCVFCATGQMGLTANLSAGQILEQVLYIARELKREGQQLTNIVVMGMGEPFHNYVETMQAMDRLNEPESFNFGARRITVSTVGLIPMIERFTREKRRENLAISLHAATDQLRDTLIPVNQKYPITPLLEACNAYTRNSGRRITFEWAMIEGVNDNLEQARNLADLLRGRLCHVNLIPLNPTSGYPGEPAKAMQAQNFRAVLQEVGIPVSIRLRRGLDIQAGCGQLAAKLKPVRSKTRK